jgi:transcriptional regulator with XRE-family HTH domain
MKVTEVRQMAFSPQALRQARMKKFPDRSLTYVAQELLAISPQQLSRYETGGWKPSPDTLAQMCALYGVDLVRDLTVKKAA